MRAGRDLDAAPALRLVRAHLLLRQLTVRVEDPTYLRATAPQAVAPLHPVLAHAGLQKYRIAIWFTLNLATRRSGDYRPATAGSRP